MKLGSADRDFIRLVAKTAFTNPFNEGEKRSQAVLDALPGRMLKLEAAGAADIRQHAGDERSAMVVALLFDACMAFGNPIDEHIGNQTRAGAAPVRADFAPDLTELLQKRGFSSDGIRHFVAIFHQIRRAHLFIGRSLVGDSASMRELKRRLWNNVFAADITTYERTLCERMGDFPTLLAGEPGTGKSAAAAALARSGYIPFDEKKGSFTRSFTSCFQSVPLATFNESQAESSVFGAEGALARCGAHGSVYLEDIDVLSLPAQAALVRILEKKPGADRFEGRLLASSTASLADQRRERRFRDDLFYRLASDAIAVPPLRQRLEERPAERDDLLGPLVARIAGRPAPALVETVSAALDESPGRRYGWPGNVRELEQAARRVLLAGRYEGDQPAAAPDLQSRVLSGVRDGNLSADALLASYCALLHRRHGTYEAVAEITGLDRRTAKKYILSGNHE